jgi:thioredoxin reductase
MATALQLRRSGVDFLIFEKNRTGGLLWNAQLIENYPGFPQGISGPALADKFREHLAKWKISISSEHIKNIDHEQDTFIITTHHNRVRSKVVVIASGTYPDALPEPSIPDQVRDRVCSEVFPLREQTGKHIVIVGAGDAAFDYALNLASSNRVTILCRGNKSDCLPLLERRAKKSRGIKIRVNTHLTAIQNIEAGLALTVKEEGKLKSLSLTADFLLVAIGRSPALDFLGPSVSNNRHKLIQAEHLYFVGDVSNRHYRQTGICIGDGIQAAMRIYERMRAQQT